MNVAVATATSQSWKDDELQRLRRELSAFSRTSPARVPEVRRRGRRRRQQGRDPKAEDVRPGWPQPTAFLTSVMMRCSSAAISSFRA